MTDNPLPDDWASDWQGGWQGDYADGSTDEPETGQLLAEWLQSAGAALVVSGDLRPRVLEEARLVHAERGVRRNAIVLLMAACFGCAVAQTADSPAPHSVRGVVVEFWEAADNVSQASDESSWRLVDAYQKLRRQQARIMGNASF